MLQKYDFDLTAEQLQEAAHKLTDGNGVPNTDLRKMPAATLKGNNSTEENATPSDLTAAQVREMLDIGEGSEANVIETVKVDGEALTPDAEKAVNVQIEPKIKSHNENGEAHADGIAGNAATADKLKTARTITVQDADGTNSAAAVSFDGSGNIVLKLPATIKAALTGNASTADKLKTARKIGEADFDGSAPITLAQMGAQPKINGGASTITDDNLTAERALVSDASGKVVASNVTADELGYMHGVTRPVQTQLDEMTLRIDGAVHRYGAMWDKTNAQMVARLWDAAGITMDTTHFAHKGSIDAAHDNPFDNIYPWSGRKLCNIDIALYMALTAGDDITACVTHWEGDADFSFDDENGVWVYTPEFYHTVYDTADGYRVFGVADGPVAGWNYQHANIGGRVWGVTENREIDGTAKNIFLPKPGMPQVSLSGATMHTYAKNYGAMLDDIFTLSAENMLYLVEYANMNSRAALGNGVDSLYRQSSDHVLEAATDTNTIKVTAANANAAIVGAILDIGTSNGGAQIAHRIITAVTVNGTTKEITFDGAPVTVTADHMWSIHGLSNPADLDSDLGSASGYLGANDQSNAYYRGRVSHGNLWRYILGAYHEQNTRHVWTAKQYADCDNYDGLNTADHNDTGVAIATSNGYAKALALIPGLGQFACCTEIGGNSSNPVADYHYQQNATTVLRVGGYANGGASDGRFFGNWFYAASTASWYYAALPFLKTPLGGS